MRATRAAIPWRPEEDEYLQTHWLTPLADQARHLRRTIDQVRNRRQRLLGFVASRMLDNDEPTTRRPRGEAAAIRRGRSFLVR